MKKKMQKLHSVVANTLKDREIYMAFFTPQNMQKRKGAGGVGK